ncbi:MAG: hypothetical protein REI11_18045 [Patulibacter sp.]|nr:hypothetical protein [Patulibacter sp.]
MIDLRFVAAVGVVAAVGLAGCGGGDDAKAPATATTAVSSTTAAAWTCPITEAQAQAALKPTSGEIVLLSKARQSCEWGVSLGTATPDPTQPDAVVALLPVPVDSLQATAKVDHPAGKIRVRTDLGRQTFEVDEAYKDGSQRVTIVSNAGGSKGSWVTAVVMPKSDTSRSATSQARTRAEALLRLL